jgi:multidrug efflux pump
VRNVATRDCGFNVLVFAFIRGLRSDRGESKDPQGMVISTLSVKRPVLATVMSLVLIVLGIGGMTLLQVRQYPDVDPPVVSVSTFYRGAPAEVVDADVTKRIIDELSGVEGIRIIDARSSDENSRINIEFRLDRNLDLAATDVRDRLQRVQNRLPDAVDDPVVRKASADASPIMWMVLTSDPPGAMTPLEMTDFADRVMVPRFENVDGVAEVRIGGERRIAMRIWLDPQAMAARSVTVNDITSRLRAENIEVPSGRIESLARELSVRTISRLGSVEEFENLVIRDDGVQRVMLADVARVEIGPADVRRYLRADGIDGIGLGIVRQSDANTLDVARGVKAELAAMVPTLPPTLNLRITTDDSVFIEASIREVLVTLGIALALVVLVILVFLGSVRATLVPALTIPVALIAPLFVLYLCGFSINVLTLLAAVLAIGLVVDDSIVVLENIERRVRGGESPLLAAVRGAGQVGFAVVATTVVLVAVFVPLSFLTGTVGRLFNEFGITLATAVIFSSFVALTFGAMLSSRVLKPHRPDDAPIHGRGPRAMFRRVTRLARGAGAASLSGYERVARGGIALRWVMVAVLVATFGAGWWLFTLLPGELTPTEDQGRFFIRVEAPEGASAEYTLQTVMQIEQVLMNDEQISESLGPIIALVPGFGGGASSNTGILIPRLRPWSERDVRQQDVVAELFPKMRQLPSARATPINPAGLGIRGVRESIEFVVSAPDYASARLGAQAILEAAADSPSFLNLETDYRPTRPQVQVSIDRDRAANLGLSIAEIGEAMQAFLGGTEVTDFLDRGELYDVILQAPRDIRGDPSDLTHIHVRGANGTLIPLSAVVDYGEAGVTRELRRVDRLPSVVISGSPAPGVSLGQALEELEGVARNVLPPEARVNYLGESLEYRETSAQLYITFGLALLLVYLVLAAQFESFLDPLTIMVTVPLAVVGGLMTLWLLGFTLNIYSQIGMILLVGIVAKNGILLVEFANQLRRADHKLTAAEAALGAARVRVRPVLMTALSTVLGAMPLVLASGAGAEGRQAIGAVVVGGLLCSTFLTLVILPAIYTLLSGLTSPANTAAARLEALSQREEGRVQPA